MTATGGGSKVAGGEALRWKRQHAPGFDVQPTEQAGISAVRVLTRVETLETLERPRYRRDVVRALASRGRLGIVHLSAATAILNVVELAAGARPPRGESGGSGDLGPLDHQLRALAQLRALRQAIEAVAVLAWPAVHGVVIDGRTLTDLAGSDRARNRARWFTALEKGLLAAARHLRMA